METERLLISEFLKLHPGDAARVIEGLPVHEAATLFEDLPPRSAAAVLRQMAPFTAVECLTLMARDRAGPLLGELPIEIAASLLRRMDATVQRSLISALPRRMAEAAQLLLRHSEDTAGAMMDPLVHVVPADITVEEAVSLVRRFAQNVYYYVYVVDRAHRLAGVLDIRELLLARPTDPVSAVMRVGVAKLPAGARLDSVVAHPGWREFDALPVVNEEGMFLGAIRNRTVRGLERERRRASAARGGAGAVFALSEAYWQGLRSLVDGVASVLAAPQSRPAPPHGAPHD